MTISGDSLSTISTPFCPRRVATTLASGQRIWNASEMASTISLSSSITSTFIVFLLDCRSFLIGPGIYRNGEGEGRTLAFLACNPNPAAVQLDEVFTQCQSES